MMNPFKEVNWRPGLAEKRRFALSLVVGFPCVAVGLLLLRRFMAGTWDFATPSYIAGAGVLVGTVLWLLPAIARPFYVLWYGLACSISIVVGNVLFLGFYFTIVTGIGLLLRTFGRAPLKRGIDKAAASYWHDAEPAPKADRYYTQF